MATPMIVREDHPDAEKAVAQLLRAIGKDPTREGLERTPERGRVAPETGPPGALTQQRQAAVVGAGFLVGEEAAGDGGRLEEREVSGCHRENGHVLDALVFLPFFLVSTSS